MLGDFIRKTDRLAEEAGKDNMAAWAFVTCGDGHPYTTGFHVVGPAKMRGAVRMALDENPELRRHILGTVYDYITQDGERLGDELRMLMRFAEYNGCGFTFLLKDTGEDGAAHGGGAPESVRRPSQRTDDGEGLPPTHTPTMESSTKDKGTSEKAKMAMAEFLLDFERISDKLEKTAGSINVGLFSAVDCGGGEVHSCLRGNLHLLCALTAALFGAAADETLDPIVTTVYGYMTQDKERLGDELRRLRRMAEANGCGFTFLLKDTGEDGAAHGGGAPDIRPEDISKN